MKVNTLVVCFTLAFAFCPSGQAAKVRGEKVGDPKLQFFSNLPVPPSMDKIDFPDISSGDNQKNLDIQDGDIVSQIKDLKKKYKELEEKHVQQEIQLEFYQSQMVMKLKKQGTEVMKLKKQQEEKERRAKVAVSRCPSGFVRFNNTCFWFSRFTATWSQARGFCQAIGVDLAVVPSAKEDSFLRRYLKRHARGRSYYVGGSDIQEEKKWRWIPSNQRVTAYTNWANREPNNWGRKEHCLQLRRRVGFKWNDIFCNRGLYFICQT